eukprot:1843910-Alexandrium_andersonii.AAC.1
MPPAPPSPVGRATPVDTGSPAWGFQGQRAPAEPIERGSASHATLFPAQVHELQAAVDQVEVGRLGEGVGGVLLPRPLQQDKVAGPHALLRPKLGHC